MIVLLINLVSADYDENCTGNCFECGCPEGYFCEPENRSCVEVDDFDLVLISDQELTEGEEKFFNEVLEPLGRFEEVKGIPLAFLKTNELMIKWPGISFGFTLDWLGKPKIEFVDPNLEQ